MFSLIVNSRNRKRAAIHAEVKPLEAKIKPKAGEIGSNRKIKMHWGTKHSAYPKRGSGSIDQQQDADQNLQ